MSADVRTRLQPWLERMRLTAQSDVVTLEPRDFRVIHGLLVELLQERDALELAAGKNLDSCLRLHDQLERARMELRLQAETRDAIWSSEVKP